jgi:hypothetical protein
MEILLWGIRNTPEHLLLTSRKSIHLVVALTCLFAHSKKKQ